MLGKGEGRRMSFLDRKCRGTFLFVRSVVPLFFDIASQIKRLVLYGRWAPPRPDRPASLLFAGTSSKRRLSSAILIEEAPVLGMVSTSGIISDQDRVCAGGSGTFQSPVWLETFAHWPRTLIGRYRELNCSCTTAYSPSSIGMQCFKRVPVKVCLVVHVMKDLPGR